jgi:hemerythrin-like metal-binding protein
MALIEWREEFSVGVPSVDHEHRGMIRLLNELHEGLQGKADKEAVAHFLGEVHAKISAHFALEEKIMRDCRYDAYEDHKADHERLLDEISDIMERHDKDIYLDVETELAAHLREWFTAHFKTQDARLHKLLG